MLKKITLLFLTIFLAIGTYAQNFYSKDEVDMKLELQQEKISSKLDAVERENNSIDAKIAAQDKQIEYQDKQIENLKFVFGTLLSVIGIIVAIGAFFIDRRNKERLSDMEQELESAKNDALQELARIKDIANLEVRMAKAELSEVKLEIKTVLGEPQNKQQKT